VDGTQSLTANARRSGQIEATKERKFDPSGAACYVLMS